MKKVALLLSSSVLFGLSIGCSSSSQSASASVTIQLPVSRTSRAANSKITAASQPASSGIWGLNDPTSAADINCFAVLVSGPERSLQTNRCFDENGNITATVGVYKFAVPAGESFSLEVPAGQNRKFTLLGMTSTYAGCTDISASTTPYVNLSNPLILGSTTSDLIAGVQTITIDAKLEGALNIGRCDFMSTPPQQTPRIPSNTLSLFSGAVGGIGNLDGTGTQARLGATSYGGVTDAAGNHYFSDIDQNIIRKISSSGVVSTIAGKAFSFGFADGEGTVARFNGPAGMAIDSAGNLYVADKGNFAIRKISPSGLVNTVAGIPQSSGTTDGALGTNKLMSPTAIALGSSGNLYFTDLNRIRMMTSTGEVTTIAGGTSAGASDGTGANASFDSPLGIAVDSSGDLFVADTFSSTIRKVTPAGVVTTISGTALNNGSTNGATSAALFYQPVGLAFGSSGALYVADTVNKKIRKIYAGTVSDFAPLAYGAYGLHLDQAGNIFYQSLGAVSMVNGSAPAQIIAGTASNLGTVDGQATVARFASPNSIVFNSAGEMIVAEGSTHLIRKIDVSGSATVIAGAAYSTGLTNGIGATARFSTPSGTAVDRSDNLFVADYGNNVIRQITPAGVVSTFAGSDGGVGNSDGTRSSARFFSPTKLAFDSQGNLFVLDYGNFTIRKIAPGGTVTTFAGVPGTSGAIDGTGAAAKFQLLNGIVIDSSDNLFVADGMTVRKITPAGVVSTFAGSASASGVLDATGVASRFGSIKDLAIDSNDNIYVADSDNYLVRKVTPQAVVTTFVGQPTKRGVSLGSLPATLNTVEAVSVRGRTLYISSENSILKYPLDETTR